MSKESRNRGNIFLLEFDPISAGRRAEDLKIEGWRIEIEFQEGGRAFEKIKSDPPDIILVDLSVKPSHGREVARALKNYSPTRQIPIIFIDGDPDNLLKTKAKIPDAIYTTSTDLISLLADK